MLAASIVLRSEIVAPIILDIDFLTFTYRLIFYIYSVPYCQLIVAILLRIEL